MQLCCLDTQLSPLSPYPMASGFSGWFCPNTGDRPLCRGRGPERTRIQASPWERGTLTPQKELNALPTGLGQNRLHVQQSLKTRNAPILQMQMTERTICICPSGSSVAMREESLNKKEEQRRDHHTLEQGHTADPCAGGQSITSDLSPALKQPVLKALGG